VVAIVLPHHNECDRSFSRRSQSPGRNVQAFITRLACVKQCCWDRFYLRDSGERVSQRAVNRRLNDEKKRGLEHWTEGNQYFYRMLYTVCSWDFSNQPVGRNWGFPDLGPIPTEFPPPQWIPIDEPLPDEWKDAPTPEQEAAYFGVPTAPAEQREEPPAEAVPESAAPGGDRTIAYLAAGRRIMKTIRNLHKKDYETKAARDALAADVWGTGTELGLYNQGKIGADQELEWRLRVYTKFNVIGALL
jgi:hypothetical protein